jgi:hypothetical protein
MRKMKTVRKFGKRLFRHRMFSTQISQVNAEKAYQLARTFYNPVTGATRKVRVRVTPASGKLLAKPWSGWDIWVDDIVQP